MIKSTARVGLLVVLWWMAGDIPAMAQTTQTFSSYVAGLPAAGALTGTEKVFLLKSGAPTTATPYQILGIMNGDCASVSPPAVVCNKTNGALFAPSATTDTTNGSNISSGTIAAARLAAHNLAGGNVNGGVFGQLPIANGGCGGTTAASCFGNVAPTPVRVGDILWWNGVTWAAFAGNNSGTTQYFGESGSGVPAWFSLSTLGTVTSVTCGTGLDGGAFTISGTCSLSAARRTLPTQQIFLGGSGTYTPTSSNVLWLKLRMVGGGGGGGGGGTGGGGGGPGGTTAFGSLTAAGGSAGGGPGNGISYGGASSGCDINITGQSGASSNGAGGSSSYPTLQGSPGGSSALFAGAGQGGWPGASGFAGTPNTGGGGGSGQSSSGLGGAGGAGGGYCEKIINSPSATAFAVGAGGTAGAAGSGNGATAGGSGGSGGIWIEEHYN